MFREFKEELPGKALLRSVASGCVGAFGLLRLFFVRAIGDCAYGWRYKFSNRRCLCKLLIM